MNPEFVRMLFEESPLVMAGFCAAYSAFWFGVFAVFGYTHLHHAVAAALPLLGTVYGALLSRQPERGGGR